MTNNARRLTAALSVCVLALAFAPSRASAQTAPGGAPSARRPVDLSMGVGLGYVLPADLQVPNFTSVRLRLPTGLTFEPFVELRAGSTSMKTPGVNSKNSDTALGIGTSVRVPLAARGRVDFILVGSGFVTHQIDDPEGADNNTSTTSFALTWGPALDFWINANWVVSMAATNPLVSIVRQHTDSPVGSTRTTTTSVGAVFDPTVIGAIHLFF
jgi:hypothetical protein